MPKLIVSAGGSRKLNHQAYSGQPYESSDVWVSLTQEVEGPTAEFDSIQLAKKLRRDVNKLLEEAADAKIKEIQTAGKGQVPFTN